jgi:hypothetical protein
MYSSSFTISPFCTYLVLLTRHHVLAVTPVWPPVALRFFLFLVHRIAKVLASFFLILSASLLVFDFPMTSCFDVAYDLILAESLVSIPPPVLEPLSYQK